MKLWNTHYVESIDFTPLLPTGYVDIEWDEDGPHVARVTKFMVFDMSTGSNRIMSDKEFSHEDRCAMVDALGQVALSMEEWQNEEE